MENHPELFYADEQIEWNYVENGAVDTILPTYTANEAVLREQIALFDEALRRAYDEIPGGLSVRDTISAVNDWICLHAEYDESLTKSSSYDLIIEGTGVCKAYTAVFGIFMDRFGIEWRKLESEAMNHTWNQVKLGEEWLHVDVTWNDPLPDEAGRALRDYLLLTDEALAEMPEAHYDWTYWE
ncbi:MAG: hypothetical protein LBE16_07225 [Clostridiales Family XIII bacterium]|jgi:transglutaminase/protease-like cytokinesis protein 3|nr:hypothetical protein [Clostridiales Family XIII bacterium]